MGDASICNYSGEGNINFQIVVIEEKYLDYLDEKLGWLSAGVSMANTAAENAETSSQFYGSGCVENYNETYRLATRRHPQLGNWAEWYESGEKVFPNEINLSPTVLKHWYCCDGHLQNNECRGIMCISMSNERGNKNKIESYFKNAELPIPKWNESNNQFVARWNVSKTEELMNYMGKPIPGFDYKFK